MVFSLFFGHTCFAEEKNWILLEKTPDGFSVFYDPSSVYATKEGNLTVVKKYTPPAGDEVKETFLTSDINCKNRTIRLLKGEIYYNNGRIEELGQQAVPSPIEEGTIMHKLHAILCKE